MAREYNFKENLIIKYLLFLQNSLNANPKFIIHSGRYLKNPHNHNNDNLELMDLEEKT